MRATHFSTVLLAVWLSTPSWGAGPPEAAQQQQVVIIHEVQAEPSLAQARGPLVLPVAPAPVVPLGGPAVSTPGPAQGAMRLPEPEDTGGGLVKAWTSRRWGLVAALALLLVILVVRKVGGVFFPVIATSKGSAWLAVAAGTVLAVVQVLEQGDPAAMVIITAAASGFWSVMKNTGLIGLLSRGRPARPAPPADESVTH